MTRTLSLRAEDLLYLRLNDTSIFAGVTACATHESDLPEGPAMGEFVETMIG